MLNDASLGYLKNILLSESITRVLMLQLGGQGSGGWHRYLESSFEVLPGDHLSCASGGGEPTRMLIIRA